MFTMIVRFDCFSDFGNEYKLSNSFSQSSSFENDYENTWIHFKKNPKSLMYFSIESILPAARVSEQHTSQIWTQQLLTICAKNKT